MVGASTHSVKSSSLARQSERHKVRSRTPKWNAFKAFAHLDLLQSIRSDLNEQDHTYVLQRT